MADSWRRRDGLATTDPGSKDPRLASVHRRLDAIALDLQEHREDTRTRVLRWLTALDTWMTRLSAERHGVDMLTEEHRVAFDLEMDRIDAGLTIAETQCQLDTAVDRAAFEAAVQRLIAGYDDYAAALEERAAWLRAADRGSRDAQVASIRTRTAATVERFRRYGELSSTISDSLRAGVLAALDDVDRVVADTMPGPGRATTATPPSTAAPPGVHVTFRVNGAVRDLSLDPRTTLLDALRDELGLTGVKKGCDQGACGACTVHVDGTRVVSCLMLAAQADGRAVVTVEGLAEEGRLHPVQEAFLRHDALQCGYCTPGQIMSAVSLLTEGRAGSDAEIREFMSGNLCRCGAYPNIVAAIRDVASAGGDP